MTQESLSLAQRVAALEHQMARLEARFGVGPAESPADGQVPHEAPPGVVLEDFLPTNSLSPTTVVFVLGRSIMVLAGAFLLRFMTESGTLPPLAGFALGLVYALGLVSLAARIGGRKPTDGIAHGLTGALVAFPFLYESIVTLKLIDPVLGAGALVLVTAAGLFTAWYRSLRALAWAFTLPALGLAAALGLATGQPITYAWILLALGAATTVLAYAKGWDLKRWLVAGLANLIIFRLSVLAADQVQVANRGELAVEAVQVLCLGLMLVYLGLFVFRALVQGRGVRAFHLCQSAAVLVIGYGGALRIAESKGTGSFALGMAALAAAAAGYLIAFFVVRQRHGRGRAFFYFASLGLVFVLLGSGAVLQGDLLTGVWLALGLLAAIVGTRFDRVTLRAHSVAYLLVAAMQTGLFRSWLDTFTAAPDQAWQPPGAMGLAALLTAMGAAALLNIRRGNRDDNRWRRLPRLAAVVLVLPGLAGLGIIAVVRLLSSVPPAADPPVVAAARTGVLGLLAIGLALAARRPVLSQLRWLVYPVLGLGLLKIVVEDLRVGDALGMFFGLGLLGGALIIAPRLLHRR